SVLACNDKSTAAHVQSPSAVRFRGSDLTSLAAPTEYPRPIVLLATICGSTVVGITLLLAAAV
ncbi:hypothetical protein EN914_34715, partial [Mesorhizobium sp. M7A.F.Ca.CA.001.08.2.1]